MIASHRSELMKLARRKPLVVWEGMISLIFPVLEFAVIRSDRSCLIAIVLFAGIYLSKTLKSWFNWAITLVPVHNSNFDCPIPRVQSTPDAANSQVQRTMGT